MYKICVFTIIIILMVILFYSSKNTPYLPLEISIEPRDNQKAISSYLWHNFFENKPLLTMLGKCEAPDGKGGIDLNAYNPKDIDGKEKFGPLQFDTDTFNLLSERYQIKNPDISNTTQQIIITEKAIADQEWWRWGCWFKLFPR